MQVLNYIFLISEDLISFLNKSCNVGLRVNVKFQIWSKAIGSIIVNNLEAAIKTLKAILATLECPFDRFWNVNSNANHKCWNPTWQPLVMRKSKAVRRPRVYCQDVSLSSRMSWNTKSRPSSWIDGDLL